MKGDGKARFFLLSTTAIRIDGSEVNPCRMRRLLPRLSTAIRVPRGMLFRYLIESCFMNIWSAEAYSRHPATGYSPRRWSERAASCCIRSAAAWAVFVRPSACPLPCTPERLERLRLAVFFYGKVGLPQILDRLALRIGHRHIYHRLPRSHAERNPARLRCALWEAAAAPESTAAWPVGSDSAPRAPSSAVPAVNAIAANRALPSRILLLRPRPNATGSLPPVRRSGHNRAVVCLGFRSPGLPRPGLRTSPAMPAGRVGSHPLFSAGTQIQRESGQETK